MDLKKQTILKVIHFRSHTLQADSAEIMHAWMTALHRLIGAAIQDHREQDKNINVFANALPGARKIKKM